MFIVIIPSSMVYHTISKIILIINIIKKKIFFLVLYFYLILDIFITFIELFYNG